MLYERCPKCDEPWVLNPITPMLPDRGFDGDLYCPECGASLTVPCTICNGSGERPFGSCPECGAPQYRTCLSCGGSGTRKLYSHACPMQYKRSDYPE